MSLVKGETSKIKYKHGLVEFCSFLFPSYIINSKLYFKKNYKYHESRGDKNKTLSIEQYLDMIKP